MSVIQSKSVRWVGHIEGIEAATNENGGRIENRESNKSVRPSRSRWKDTIKMSLTTKWWNVYWVILGQDKYHGNKLSIPLRDVSFLGQLS